MALRRHRGAPRDAVVLIARFSGAEFHQLRARGPSGTRASAAGGSAAAHHPAARLRQSARRAGSPGPFPWTPRTIARRGSRRSGAAVRPASASPTIAGRRGLFIEGKAGRAAQGVHCGSGGAEHLGGSMPMSHCRGGPALSLRLELRHSCGGSSSACTSRTSNPSTSRRSCPLVADALYGSKPNVYTVRVGVRRSGMRMVDGHPVLLGGRGSAGSRDEDVAVPVTSAVPSDEVPSRSCPCRTEFPARSWRRPGCDRSSVATTARRHRPGPLGGSKVVIVPAAMTAAAVRLGYPGTDHHAWPQARTGLPATGTSAPVGISVGSTGVNRSA